MASKTHFKLNTGAKIPAIGFGTWQDKHAQEKAVETALKAGYRHIDTARVYGTEPAVGAAIRKSGVPRSEIFITTKLWNNAHHPDDVEKALNASLKDLGTDYVDLYLMVCIPRVLHSHTADNSPALAGSIREKRQLVPQRKRQDPNWGC